MHGYYFDNLPGDERLPHDSGRPASIETIQALNIQYWHVPVDIEGGWEKRIEELSKENNFKNQDTISVTEQGLGDAYADILKEFFDEHLHEDDEIRYVVKGAGYYDVREHPTDEWIRIHIGSGDLIAIPKGIYHRFMLDELNEIAGLRLWKDVPNWTPLPRTKDTDTNSYRLKYLASLKSSSASSSESWVSWIGSVIGRFILWK